MQLTEFDLSTSSDSSVSLPSAFCVSVLFCLTQEKTCSQCALLWGMVRMPSFMLARVRIGFTPPPFFLSLGSFHNKSILSRTQLSIVVHWYSANASNSESCIEPAGISVGNMFTKNTHLQGDIHNLSSLQYLVLQRLLGDEVVAHGNEISVDATKELISSHLTQAIGFPSRDELSRFSFSSDHEVCIHLLVICQLVLNGIHLCLAVLLDSSSKLCRLRCRQ